MTDDQLQAQRDAETPDKRELRDVRAQLRSVLAALNDLPFRQWPPQLKAAVGLCDLEDIAIARGLWREGLVRRYEQA